MKNAFTLIEILVGIGILAILAAIVIIAINPGQQFADARDAQRKSDVRTILDAVQQNMISNKGIWQCNDKETADPLIIPEDPINIGSGAGDLDICHCLVPNYIAALPADPSVNTSYVSNCASIGSEYSTGYDIETEGSRLKVSAPYAEGATISITR